jgi:hypothetical protein
MCDFLKQEIAASGVAKLVNRTTNDYCLYVLRLAGNDFTHPGEPPLTGSEVPKSFP